MAQSFPELNMKLRNKDGSQLLRIRFNYCSSINIYYYHIYVHDEHTQVCLQT